jgi:ribosome maturation factor RimP
MADLDALHQMIEAEATALGFTLVRVRLFGKGDERTLQVMAERPDTRQLVIEDCAALSRAISDRLDEAEEAGRDPIEGAYRLEVSSPGIDRPLTRLQDYSDWSGHEARLTLDEPLDGQKHFRGDIEGVENDEVLLRNRTGALARVPFDRIEDAKLTLTDKLIAATVPLSVEGADEEDFDDMSADADGQTEDDN